MPSKKPSMDALKAFVRQEAPNYLQQENVTSIGVGYKVKEGRTTRELSIQFTVGRKIAPEMLEALSVPELPKSFEIDGVEVPTDVIERNYDTHAKPVKLVAKLEASSSRKTAVNPIVPGVSIGHPSISAGTVGCVVYDAHLGTPYILSNWHILNGALGMVGDNIVQPGRHDDNRTQRNIVGKLVRSHLGSAGDCAIASIDRRKLEPELLDLNVAVEEIGEPELDDLVIKSGRTTDVTYGVVKRVHAIVAMDYDGIGTQQIGCFEIGPDPKHPATNDQISMGGDSGSAWMLVKQGKATPMMLGLHFAGEVGDQPDHALACYAASVFEKLEILPTKPAQVAVDDAVIGYLPNFVGSPIPLPTPSNDEVVADVLVDDGETVFNYMHFSLAMSRSRRFAYWVAWNIDGGSIRQLSRKGMRFKKDPNLPRDAQIGNELYTKNSLDQGHIARRADLLWGMMEEARQANIDSFYYTNITPQHREFNQSGAHGIWGQLENAVFEEVDVEDLHVSVLGGPVFADDDPLYRGVQLPRQFWKIIYFRETGNPAIKSKAYLLTQADLLNQIEVLDLPQFAVFEIPIARISDLTGLSLPEGSPVMGSGAQPEALEEVPIRRITSVREILG